MSTLDLIKNQIKRLYETNPCIHVNIKMSQPKLSVTNIPVRIKGVYPNLFRLEETDSDHPRSHSIRYSEVLTGQVEISELGMTLQDHSQEKKRSIS